MSSAAPNEVWCLDFCHDSCLSGTKLKVLAVKGEFTRELLALEAATSFKSLRVQSVLATLFLGRSGWIRERKRSSGSKRGDGGND